MHMAKPVWISNRGRVLNIRERMRLMGLDPKRLNLAVSKSQFEAQLGNSMPLNVLTRLLCQIVPAVGLAGPLPDRWADGCAQTELTASAQK